ncbi:hypothetical protein [Arthrobacter sp. TMN-50]
MPKAFPDVFRRDVIAVARKGEAPVTQIAKEKSGLTVSPDLTYLCGGSRENKTVE